MKFENVNLEIYILIIILSLVFFIISNKNISTLLSIIIILLLTYSSYIYLNILSNNKDTTVLKQKYLLDDDIKDRNEISENIFYIDKFATNLKYLKKNQKLIDIASNIRFIRKFNKTRYGDILLNMNKLTKIYIYILSNRYDFKSSLPLFIDIRENILEIMNSLVLIIPATMKHSYGIKPHEEIIKSINEFSTYTSDMIDIMKKYATIHLNENYIPVSNIIL